MYLNCHDIINEIECVRKKEKKNLFRDMMNSIDKKEDCLMVVFTFYKKHIQSRLVGGDG